MTPAALKSYSHKDLAQMAKQGGVRGWHSMRKDQLVKALLTAAKTKTATAKKSVVPARRSTAASATIAPTRALMATSSENWAAFSRSPSSTRRLKRC